MFNSIWNKVKIGAGTFVSNSDTTNLEHDAGIGADELEQRIKELKTEIKEKNNTDHLKLLPYQTFLQGELDKLENISEEHLEKIKAFMQTKEQLEGNESLQSLRTQDLLNSEVSGNYPELYTYYSSELAKLAKINSKFNKKSIELENFLPNLISEQDNAWNVLKNLKKSSPESEQKILDAKLRLSETSRAVDNMVSLRALLDAEVEGLKLQKESLTKKLLDNTPVELFRKELTERLTMVENCLTLIDVYNKNVGREVKDSPNTTSPTP